MDGPTSTAGRFKPDQNTPVTLTRELDDKPDQDTMANVVGEMCAEILLATAGKWAPKVSKANQPVFSLIPTTFSPGPVHIVLDNVNGHWALS
ncbi:hypothetical protein LTR93_012241, partial [Exophiala xenobiotica]